MKIARHVAVFGGTMNGTALPGSLSEGVYFVARNKSKISEFIMTGGTIERHSLSHALAGVPAPSKREPGNAPHNVNHPPAGCFVSGRVIFAGSAWGICFAIHRSTLPQSRPFGRASSLREGAGRGCAIQRAARKPGGGGRFSSPLRRLRSFYMVPSKRRWGYLTISREKYPASSGISSRVR